MLEWVLKQIRPFDENQNTYYTYLGSYIDSIFIYLYNAITLLRKENENLKMKLEAIELKTLDIDNRLVHVEAISENILPHAESDEQNFLLTPLQIESGVVDQESSSIRQEESSCHLSTRRGP